MIFIPKKYRYQLYLKLKKEFEKSPEKCKHCGSENIKIGYCISCGRMEYEDVTKPPPRGHYPKEI